MSEAFLKHANCLYVTRNCKRNNRPQGVDRIRVPNRHRRRRLRRDVDVHVDQRMQQALAPKTGP